MTRRRPAAFLLLPLLLAGCTVLGFDGDDEDALRDARDRWLEHRPENYSYVLERLCFCGGEVIGPVRILVHGDSVVQRIYTETDEPVAPQFAALFGPMESVFAVIEEALERDADSLDVRYHAERGYPISVAIDYVKNAVDEELTLKVSDFRGLTP